MWAYIIRRILWTIPIVLGIVVLTFALFSLVAQDPARQYAGKQTSEQQLQAVRHRMGLDKPRWFKWRNPIRDVQVADGTIAITTEYDHGLKPGQSVTIAGLGSAAADRKVVAVDGPRALRFRASLPATRPADLRGAWAAPSGLSMRLRAATDSQFFDVLLFRFPKSMRYQESVWTLFARKAPVSLAIQLPAFIIALGLELVLALLVAANRGRWPDRLVTLLAVLGMSLPALSIYLGAQWLFGARLAWFPVAGWEIWPYWLSFAALPILVMVLGGIGAGTRFYRTVVLEEVNADYVRTARSKGVPTREVYLTHVMRNVMIPVLTNTITALPGLLLGALLLERLFQIPGFGGLMVESIFNNDRPVVMAIVYVTSIAYCLMLLLTDILYAVADPRVSLR